MKESIINAVLGGGLIGLSASLMLIFNGRVTGIAGIYNGVVKKIDADFFWRLALVLGLAAGGAFVYVLKPELFVNESGRSMLTVFIAGLLVGFGTIMGSGCTSGHGVCGIARLSMRSVSATVVFMLFGFLTATAFRYFFLGNF
jgi:uncharacterized membrane protein YedE/YeeE